MMNYQQAEKIDTLLNLIVNFNGNDQIRIKDLALKLQISNTEMVFLVSELKNIRHDDNPVIAINHGEYLNENGHINELNFIKILVYKNHNTRKFIDSGGCVAWYNKLLQEQQKQKDREELEEQKLLNDIASFKISKKQYLWNKWIAIAGLIIALISILIQIIIKH